MKLPGRALIWPLAATTASLLAACYAHVRVANRSVPRCEHLAVVVLGYPSFRSGRVHPVQRWRSRLAADTAMAYNAELVVLSGAGRPSEPSEAAVMAKLAEQYGLGSAQVLLEESSTDTWQNVTNSRLLVEAADCVVLVSDPLHAARARRYWSMQSPGDVERVYITDRCRFWDGWWLKLPTALNAAKHVVRNRYRSIKPRIIRPLAGTHQELGA